MSATTDEAAIQKLGQDLYHAMAGNKPGVFDARFWESKLLAWSMQDPDFKVDLFRFVDVLPMLTDSSDVARAVQEYLLRPGRNLPSGVSTALKMASGSLTAGLGAAAIRRNVTDMAKRFIAGEDTSHAFKVLDTLRRDKLAFTVDLLGEHILSEKEADHYQKRYLEALQDLSEHVANWDEQPLLDTAPFGSIPKANLSIKLSTMYSQMRSVDLEGSVAAIKKRVLPVFLQAKALGVFINVDVEQWDTHDIVYTAFEEIATHPELRNWPHLGIVVQAYLKQSSRDIERLLALVRSRGTPISVRLVKGAYWDVETLLARQRGWECPVFSHKVATDENYERLSLTLIQNANSLRPAFASHNLRSLSHALVAGQKLPKGTLEVQMLYGMAEPERDAILGQGQRIRIYTPIGELLPGMAYLVRRLLENTANESFLRLSHETSVKSEELLKKPTPPAAEDKPQVQGFQSCPLLDLSLKTHRTGMQSALEGVAKTLPLTVPVCIEGKPVPLTGELFARPNPSQNARVVAKVAVASAQDVERAVQVALKAWPAWRDRSLEERGAMLLNLADRLERDRQSLAAWMVWEVGKPWVDADADVAEAIDFCRYYAAQARVELAPRRQGMLPGEDNLLYYEGRGIAAVIAPWNFPLAILCGMSVAALAAGNAVLLKPAEQSSAVGYRLYQHMLDAGIPSQIVAFLPGTGEVTGDALVRNKDVATIAFTGSKDVGLSIVKDAAITQPGQHLVKRVICEMGGKNALIIDADADLDEALTGALHSAFGYSGQKCSACSRLLIHQKVYATAVARLLEGADSIRIGAADHPATVLGPVIDESAHARLLKLIESPPQGARILYRGTAPTGGYYVPPTIVEVTDPQHAFMHEEFFGPILTVYAVRDFDEALQVANATDYALTGGVYSRTPSHLERARRQFRVGNLYLNRGTTGAFVYRQPFGGFGMSGTGPKAGGPNYLLQFADARCTTENTMRRGFAPPTPR